LTVYFHEFDDKASLGAYTFGRMFSPEQAECNLIFSIVFKTLFFFPHQPLLV